MESVTKSVASGSPQARRWFSSSFPTGASFALVFMVVGFFKAHCWTLCSGWIAALWRKHASVGCCNHAFIYGHTRIGRTRVVSQCHSGNFSKMLPLKVPNHKQKNKNMFPEKIRLFQWDANYSRNCIRKRRADLGPESLDDRTPRVKKQSPNETSISSND